MNADQYLWLLFYHYPDVSRKYTRVWIAIQSMSIIVSVRQAATLRRFHQENISLYKLLIRWLSFVASKREGMVEFPEEGFYGLS